MGRFAGTKRKDKATPRPGGRGFRWRVLILAAALGWGWPAAGQVAPDADWRTLDTQHFSVTFPSGMEALGRRAAARAEEAWSALAAVLPPPDRGRIELLLTGDADISNGLATVTPARRIVVYLRPPVDGFALAHFDDWLDLVITHELAHVFHLDVTGGLGRLLRAVFGRLPSAWPLFPGRGTPDWTIEGLATWYETEFTGVGRTGGTYFEMMLRTAALEGRFDGIDRASGRSAQWPAGETSYLYGSLFFDHLLDRYGPERMILFVRAVGGQWVPYRLDAAAQEAFGVSFSDAWAEWKEGWRARAGDRVAELEASGGVTVPERLTQGGRLAVYPRVSPAGEVAYARADGRSDPAIAGWRDGDARADRLMRTNGVSRFDWGPDGSLVLGQTDFRDPYRLHSDLWRRHPDGRVSRLTRGARLDHPTASPDGMRVAAIQYHGAAARLVTIPAGGGAPEILADGGDTWAFPAWSPDGLWIAASRWTPQGVDVVVLNAASGEVALEVTRDRALDLAPAWGPDSRTLLWGSDRSGIPQIVASRVDPVRGVSDPPREVTRLATGAAFPTVDPSGEWAYFSMYTAEGWELARVPYRPELWTPAGAPDPRFAEAPPRSEPLPVEGTTRDYSSLPSLRPRYWQPLVIPGESAPDGSLLRPFVGFATSASDLVGRHAVSLQGAISLSGRELNGRLEYVWAGLGNPILDLRAEQEWDGEGPFRAQRDSASPVERLYVREREQRVSLGATLVHRRWTRVASVSARAGMVWESRSLLDSAFAPATRFSLSRPESRLAEGRLAASFSTVRGHALSLGAEDGVALFALASVRREQAVPDSAAGVAGLDRSTDELLANFRAYRSFRGPGFADHVLAVRMAGGAARGPGADAFTFEVGGAAGQTEPVTGLGLFGSSALFFPVRGYRNGDRSGRYAWSASAEYRFPLLRVNRGIGLFPLHLDMVHGSLFADAGNAWGPELGFTGYQRPREGALWAAGGELSARLTALFDVTLTLRTGVAFPGVSLPGLTSPTWYLRLGPSF